MSLSGLIGDRYNVGGVIDDDGVVDVVVDDIFRRRRDVFRGTYPNRDRRIVRIRKYERVVRRWWRR